MDKLFHRLNALHGRRIDGIRGKVQPSIRSRHGLCGEFVPFHFFLGDQQILLLLICNVAEKIKVNSHQLGLRYNNRAVSR